MARFVNFCHTMKAIVIDTDSQPSLIDMPVPELQPDEALVRTKVCGLCGTDLLKINLKMLKQPTVLGHEWVGEIVKLGDKVHGFLVGDRIVTAHHYPCGECHFCHHDAPSMCSTFKSSNFKPGGFAEFVVLSAQHLNQVTFKLPLEMSELEAIFTEPLACCLRNVNRLPLKTNDTLVMVGLGSIGLMMGSLFKLKGHHVIGVDLDAKRCAVAKDFGIDHTFMAFDDDFTTQLGELTQGRGADGVIFTAGPATLLNKSLGWLRGGGFVNLFSHLSGEIGPIDTAQLYHHEIQIFSTYSSDPASLKEAFAILKSDQLKLRRMLAPLYRPQDFAEAVQAVNARQIYKAAVEW